MFKANGFIVFSYDSPTFIILLFFCFFIVSLDKMDYSISFHTLPNKSNINFSYFRTNLNGQFMLISRDTGFNISINVEGPGKSAVSAFCHTAEPFVCFKDV